MAQPLAQPAKAKAGQAIIRDSVRAGLNSLEAWQWQGSMPQAWAYMPDAANVNISPTMTITSTSSPSVSYNAANVLGNQ